MTKRELPDLIDSADDADSDAPSITEVNGTVARFTMTYGPEHDGPLRFGPPRSQLWPSYAFALCTLLLGAATAYAYFVATSGPLFRFIVEGDRGRALPAWVLAAIIGASGIATAIRASMRGVVLSDRGIEARSILMLGVPKVERWAWPQIDRFVLDDKGVLLELWNGTYARLPDVADGAKLADCIEQIAAARKREVTRLKPLGKSG
jgi:hypothetical protein